MPTQITNQANLTFTYGTETGTATSNIATATLLDPIFLEKTSVGSTYRAGDRITYVLSLQNNGNATLSNITLTDNLGAYTQGTVTLRPLTFDNNASLYINGVYSAPIEGVVNGNVTFTIPTLAPGANALVIYNAIVNDFAPLAPDSTIVNTATVTAAGITTPVSESNTITVEDYADIRMQKEMSPDPISDGDTITYTFTIRNYGNIDATDVVLTDAFNPAPSSITVTANGTPVAATNYTYNAGLLTLPTGTAFSLTVPAATVTEDPVTGERIVSPGTLVITVSGVI